MEWQAYSEIKQNLKTLYLGHWLKIVRTPAPFLNTWWMARDFDCHRSISNSAVLFKFRIFLSRLKSQRVFFTPHNHHHPFPARWSCPSILLNSKATFSLAHMSKGEYTFSLNPSVCISAPPNPIWWIQRYGPCFQAKRLDTVCPNMPKTLCLAFWSPSLYLSFIALCPSC